MTWAASARLVLGCVLAGCALVVGCVERGMASGPGMRVELNTEGGFAAIPGLAKPVSVDAADLSSDLSKELQRLVNSALAEKAPAGSVKRSPVPDGRRYRISVQRGGSRDEVEADDPVTPPAFDALMDFVRANGRR